MDELEQFTDAELYEQIEDCDWVLSYGCTLNKMKEINFIKNACAEILRRRNYDPRQEQAPEWFNRLIDDNE